MASNRVHTGRGRGADGRTAAGCVRVLAAQVPRVAVDTLVCSDGWTHCANTSKSMESWASVQLKRARIWKNPDQSCGVVQPKKIGATDVTRLV